jgi:phosphatidylglycerol:prolipoprotein diacylglycerol transferase
MLTISIDPIILSIGHFALRWYGLILLAAMAIGVWLTAREAERKGFKKEEVYDAAVWIVIAGIIGARVFHVLDHWSHTYAVNPVRALYIWEGGLAIWGAIIGGLIAGALVTWKKNWNLPRFLDAAAPGLVLAQAVGRIACVITGDAMGKPTTGPFGFAYTSPNAMVPELGVYYTPMPLYELGLNLTIFVALWRLRKRNWPDGMLFLVYLTLYSFERFFLAFTSSYRIIAFGLTQSQIVAVFAFVIGLTLLLLVRRRFNVVQRIA